MQEHGDASHFDKPRGKNAALYDKLLFGRPLNVQVVEVFKK